MAQLFRVSRLYDSSESQTFTFILPPAAALEYPPEILSRDFMYAGHKWRISLLKQDRHLSPYLQMTSACEGVRCWLDFTFVLVHRQSFTDSEQFAERQREFAWRRSTHGCRTFVTLDDLSKRQFTDARGEFLFELILKNPKTIYEQIFTLNVTAKTSTVDAARHNDARDYQRYDSTTINYGEQEWVCVFCPNMDRMENGNMRHMVQMNRRSRSDTLCKIRYRIILGRNPSDPSTCIRSENREEIFDFIGTGEAFYFTDDYLTYAHDGNRLQLTLELNSISCVNHMKLNVLSTDKRPVAQCFDRDRQTWCITTTPSSLTSGGGGGDTTGGGGRRRSRASLGAGVDGESNQQDDNRLSFTLLYPDVQNIPRNYSRFVSWAFHVIPSANKRRDSSTNGVQPTAVGAQFEHYYSQMETDNGFVMRTKLSLNEIKQDASKWLDDVDQRLTIQLEWLGSYLLLHPAYHSYDDVYRKHIVQMRREVQALQAENNSLEKQVHDFQLMMSNKSSSGPDTPTRPRSGTASSNVSGTGSASLQPPTPVGGSRNLPSGVPPPGQSRTVTSTLADALSVAGNGDSRRPPRSASGIDVSSGTAASSNADVRPSTPRKRSGSGTEPSQSAKDYRNGASSSSTATSSSQHLKLQTRSSDKLRESESELRAECKDNNGQDIALYSPPSPTWTRPTYLSPAKQKTSLRSISDVPIASESHGGGPSIRRVGSSRCASRTSRRRSPNPYDPYDDDDDDFNDRPEHADRGRSDTYMTPAGALVRSKSASPYPQRHQHPVNSVNSYWRTDTPPRSSDDESREAVVHSRKAAAPGGLGVGQLKPEITRFGDDERSNSPSHHHRTRSFRVGQQNRERKLTSPRRSNMHGREAEDIGDVTVRGGYYHYR